MATFNTQIVKLRFKGPLHIGTGRNDNYDHSDELLHSDTIKSALYVVFRQIYPGEINDDYDLRFFNSFQVSSAFPFFGNELFFPKPLAGVKIDIQGLGKDQSSKLSKKSKKIQFIGLSVFEKLIAGQTIAINEKQLDDSGRFVFSEPPGEEIKILTRHVQQRVYIPHQGEENHHSQPYYIERMYFADMAGLYFMLKCDDEILIKKIEVCLRILGDTGFGTDKNVGNGQFEAHLSDLNIKVPDQPLQKMALSLFCPTPEAVQEQYLNQSSFMAVKRGGYIVSANEQKFRHFRKKSVHMFAEGSVFPAATPGTGKIVDLKPETVSGMHPVWRDGTCLFLPVKL